MPLWQSERCKHNAEVKVGLHSWAHVNDNRRRFGCRPSAAAARSTSPSFLLRYPKPPVAPRRHTRKTWLPMSNIGKSLFLSSGFSLCSLTYHERDAQGEVSGGAHEVRHFAVHPAHDVHVHGAALETRAGGGGGGSKKGAGKVGKWVTSEYSYQPSHAELKAEHQVELLPFEPVDCVRVLGHGQGLPSDAVHARRHRRRVSTAQGRVQLRPPHTKFCCCATSYPNTKRPTSHSQKQFTKAPVANITLGKKKKRKVWFWLIFTLGFTELTHLSNTDKQRKDDGAQPIRKEQNGVEKVLLST